MTTKQQAKQARAYSYQRFSSGKQAQGDSIRRQNESAIAYAKQHNLTLDDSTTIQDLGVSAFKNKNMESNLGTFIKAIENKKIQTPCHLLLESLDRYSRRPAIESLFSLYSQLVNKGVTVHIIKSGHVIDKESLLNPLSIIIPLIEFSRSHDESNTKSLRVKAAWDNKRKTASINNPIGKYCPKWIDIKDNKYVIHKQHGKTIKLIANMGLQGYGAGSITKYLTKNNIPTTSDNNKVTSWEATTVKRYLKSKALIGIHEYTAIDETTGKRVKTNKEVKLYPSLITDNEYYKLQGILNKRSHKVGSDGNNIANLFGGLMTDYDEGSSIRIKYGLNKLMTTASVLNGAAESKSFPYALFEQSIMLWLTSKKYKIKKVTIKTIDIDSIEAQIDINKSKLDKIAKSIEDTEDINSMASLIDLSKKLQDKVNELNINLANEKIKQSEVNNEDELYTLKERMNLTDYDSRVKMRMALNNLIDNIKIAFRPTSRMNRLIYVMINMKDGTSHYMAIMKDRGKDELIHMSRSFDGKNYNNDEHFNNWIESPTFDKKDNYIFE